MNTKRSMMVFISLIILILLVGPSQLVMANQDDLPELRGWSNFHYITVPGSVLRPRNSTTPWFTDGSGGCISVNTYALEVLNVDLNLPQGSRIDYLRLYYYDTSASNSIAWVTTYNGAGGYTDRTNVQSVGTSGYGTNLSAYVGHIVDNANNAYVLNFRPNQIGSTMQLCALRVAYRVPLWNFYLPLIVK